MGACIQRIGAGEQENVIRAVAEAMRRSVISILKNVRRLRRKRKNILSKPISFGIREISCRKRMASICVAKSPYYLYRVLDFATDLSKVDDEFAGIRRPGFYDVDSEWGYVAVDDVAWWAEITPDCPGKRN